MAMNMPPSKNDEGKCGDRKKLLYSNYAEKWS
jgi:hypothetical protein